MAALTMKTFALLAVLVLAACGQTPVERFRSASPSAQGLELKLPSGGTSRQGLNDDQPALMPGVTLLATLVVNGGVAVTLGVVAAIVAEEPTVITEDHAEWGPFTQPLWKHSFRLKMDRVDERAVTYVLERRPKSSTADADFAVVLSGQHEFGGQRQLGSFTLLDLEHSSRAEVSYTRTRTRDVEVKVAFRGGAAPADYAYSQLEGGDGSFEFIVTSNFDTRTAAAEQLVVKSRWQHSGAGRADVTGQGGDLAAEVRFTECWNADLNRTYYHDTVGLFPTEGAADACVLRDESFSTLVSP